MLNLECSVGIGRNASVTIFEPDYNNAIIFAFVSDSFSVQISDLFHGDILLSCKFEKKIADTKTFQVYYLWNARAG